ncbi:hypothetical protein IIC38_13565 [candidate division KSB1 bacterium]|nr:hypothetical protein [candidate division KSB1 bacterium]
MFTHGGELVARALAVHDNIAHSLERAFASNKPPCINGPFNPEGMAKH